MSLTLNEPCKVLGKDSPTRAVDTKVLKRKHGCAYTGDRANKVQIEKMLYQGFGVLLSPDSQ